MKRVLSFLCLSTALCLAVAVRGAEVPSDADLLPAEKETSKQRMMQIYEAIQAYRNDHKALPGYLSDLYPEYIADTNLFICPTALRRNQTLPFPELLDPKLLVHFGYEFSARPIQAMFGYSGPMTMGTWKRLQMTVVGGVVPLLRCFAYDQVLNVSFDGKFYLSALQWEDTVRDKVNLRELEPRYLRLALLKQLGGEVGGESLAFEQLKDSFTSDNRGVVISDKPLEGENKKWNQEVAQTALATADQAKKFLEQYPQSPNASEAAQIDREMLLKASAAGSPEAAQRLETSVSEKLKTPGMTENQRFELRSLQLQLVQAKLNTKPAAEKQQAIARECRLLIKEFPKRSESYLALLSAARDVDEATVRSIVDEVRQSDTAPEEAKERAQALLNRVNLVGHPPDIQFTALDGREVELGKLRGKVVLVDFWATWCGPCVGEIPHVKEAYERLHPRGFEIIGISFDSDKAALEKFVKARELPWPQYFDGKGWQNKFGQRYDIQSIPTMWLLDRKGNVVDVNARSDLAGKVEHLLAEK